MPIKNPSNAFMSWLLRSPLHSLVSGGMLLLSYTGRKSGRTITVPISYQAQPDGSLLSTSLRTRTWWRSLRGGAPVLLHLRGRPYRAAALALEDHQAVSEALASYFSLNPGAARFFNVTLAANGQPSAADLARLARERVVIRFTLEKGNAV